MPKGDRRRTGFHEAGHYVVASSQDDVRVFWATARKAPGKDRLGHVEYLRRRPGWSDAVWQQVRDAPEKDLLAAPVPPSSGPPPNDDLITLAGIAAEELAGYTVDREACVEYLAVANEHNLSRAEADAVISHAKGIILSNWGTFQCLAEILWREPRRHYAGEIEARCA